MKTKKQLVPLISDFCLMHPHSLYVALMLLWVMEARMLAAVSAVTCNLSTMIVDQSFMTRLCHTSSMGLSSGDFIGKCTTAMQWIFQSQSSMQMFSPLSWIAALSSIEMSPCQKNLLRCHPLLLLKSLLQHSFHRGLCMTMLGPFCLFCRSQ